MPIMLATYSTNKIIVLKRYVSERRRKKINRERGLWLRRIHRQSNYIIQHQNTASNEHDTTSIQYTVKNQ